MQPFALLNITRILFNVNFVDIIKNDRYGFKYGKKNRDQ